MLLLHEVERRGVDPSGVLRRLGLRRERVTTVGGLILGIEALRLCRELLQVTGDPELGLVAGAAADVSQLGLAGVLLRSSDDVRTAYSTFVRWAGRALPSVKVSADSDGFVIRYVPELGVATPRMLHDTVLAAAQTVGSQISGGPTAHLATFAYPEPQSTAAHRQVFGCQVLFGDSSSRLVLPPGIVAQPLPNRDPLVARTVAPYVSPLVSGEPAEDLTSQVRRVLMACDSGQGMPDILDVAARMAISPRTLRRRLFSEGTSFVLLVEEAKRELALAAVIEIPHRPGRFIAERLGYGDPPAFYRAFKRWTGRSLTEYRKDVAGCE